MMNLYDFGVVEDYWSLKLTFRFIQQPEGSEGELRGEEVMSIGDGERRRGKKRERRRWNEREGV